MSDPVFQYRYTIDDSVSDHARGIDTGWERLSDSGFRDRPEHARMLTAPLVDDQMWAQDLWRVARAVYLADRRSPRDRTADNWTRTIVMSIQVFQPDRWGPHCTLLNDLLQVLTGDRWDVRVHGGVGSQGQLPVQPEYTHVALFSGGLDSTAYAAQRAGQLDTSERALFVAYDATVGRCQRRVFEDIKRLAPPETVRMEPTRLSPHGGALDHSNRSRGFLYIATAVCLAAINGAQNVMVPENGQLACNPALTPGRRSACSTRSVHPWTLYAINQLITRLGGGVTVDNPLLHKTKGQVCALALDAGLSWSTLEQTVSCGHPTSPKRPSYHCGHCFPCLVRRSGLHAVRGDRRDDTIYETGLQEIELTDLRTGDSGPAADLRDLIRWLDTDFTVDDLIADAPFPPGTPHTLMPVLHHGRHELRTMLVDLLPDAYPPR
ncbi:7-cyano-7-deazaguanine synthase [Nocardia sp. CC201C]|uniref:7-cyano-7-deazaguanine synthase n=1 Tax=Nocardia sp. CC201C TaxID=3044575 RepID=UPI0024A7F9CB|nr:7-cyano-7-deazaguanine synthase [Nocardia sp. CC201C]